jgi:SAM-dependent methyltransferase
MQTSLVVPANPVTLSPAVLDSRVRLNLGSGRRYEPSAVNVDVTPDTQPDVVHDLNRRPWPFADDRFDEVEMRDVLEHLDDTISTLEEIHRVCRPGALVHIIVPHYSSNGAFTDPTHKRFFALASFDYLTAGHPNNFYTRARFSRVGGSLVFRPGLLNKVVWRLANRFPVAYEERWAWMFPAWFISISLRVEKPHLRENGATK